MNYTLAILTHGVAPHLGQCLDAFDKFVTPAPTLVRAYRDGGELHALPGLRNAATMWSLNQRGFCHATAALWQFAAVQEPTTDYVFYLEHDFLVSRPVDLRDLAAVLDAHLELTQVSLMRDAYSAEERAAGGLFESRDGARRWQRHAWGYVQSDYVITTNPSLMRRVFMADNPWPPHQQFCEGKFGIELREKGYVGGVYGDGSVYCRHVGSRDGFGY